MRRPRRLSPRRSPDALEVAVGAFARRDLTGSELDQRLARAGFAADARSSALARLREAGYVDDTRVALDRANRLAGRGLGDAAIRFDLDRRGVPGDVIEEALASLECERARASRLARSLGGGQRAARALARKGFEADAIANAVEVVADDA
jgi:SOS response regulatory protein OraA/RecX